MYYEVKVKLQKINLLRSEDYYSGKIKRKALVFMSALVIVIANIFYRIVWYDPGSHPNGKDPGLRTFDMMVCTLPFACEFIVFAVALF